MARPQKKLSVHFEEPIAINKLSPTPDFDGDVEDQVQLKEISSARKQSFTYRMSQVVFRRKKSRISEPTIVVLAIVCTVVFMLSIVSWLVFSENSTMRTSRLPEFAQSPSGRHHSG